MCISELARGLHIKGSWLLLHYSILHGEDEFPLASIFSRFCRDSQALLHYCANYFLQRNVHSFVFVHICVQFSLRKSHLSIVAASVYFVQIWSHASAFSSSTYHLSPSLASPKLSCMTFVQITILHCR